MAGLGTPRVHFRRAGSTNEHARRLADLGAPHGTVVTASEQTAGRGRQGRTWWAPPDSSLLMSLIVRWPDGLAAPPELLPLIAGVAVCEIAGPNARLKWPNDVVVEQSGGLAKLAGILVEGRPQAGWAVVGIGLNVAVDVADVPNELRGSVASLERPSESVAPLLANLLSALEVRLAQPAGTILDEFRARDVLRGREINWTASLPAEGAAEGRRRGRADGVDGTGRLIAVADDGTRMTLQAGEVHLG
jgi:BirA family biotin operon repressor/biotin-[acetyl-CoA-carboxylase] ligase